MALPTLLSLFFVLSLHLSMETANFRLLTTSTVHAWQLLLSWSDQELANIFCIFQQNSEIKLKNYHLCENLNISVECTELCALLHLSWWFFFLKKRQGGRILELDTQCVKWPTKHIKLVVTTNAFPCRTIVLKHLWNALTKHNEVLKTSIICFRYSGIENEKLLSVK
jgi:hypothetical protein